MTINRRTLITGSSILAGTAALPLDARSAVGAAPVLQRSEDAELWRELDGLISAGMRMQDKLRLAASSTHPIIRSAYLMEMRCAMRAMLIHRDFVVAAAADQHEVDRVDVARFRAAEEPPSTLADSA